jgi:hypothetical protein
MRGLYFGIPLTIKEAFRLFDIEYNDSSKNYYESYDKLNDFFKNNQMKMRLHYLDKGQCVLGYHFTLSPLNRIFYNVNDVIIKLTDYKVLYFTEIEPYKKNFEIVTLEHLEDKPEKVQSPQPYVIEFDY